jgi:site-specific DNA-methyltransferase (adenine-specific)
MRPYYDEGGCTIYHGDCREVMPSLRTAIDMILADPPYVGLRGGYEFTDGGVATRNAASVAVGDPWGATWDWIPSAKALKPSALISFTTHHGMRGLLNAVDSDPILIGAWRKPNAHPGMPQMPHYTSEFYVGFRFDARVKWNRTPDSIVVAQDFGGCISNGERLRNSDGSNVHPTQKPLRVMSRLLLDGANVILDPFCGTGTTLRAAKDFGRAAIGIEIDERYCEVAARRLAQEVLF